MQLLTRLIVFAACFQPVWTSNTLVVGVGGGLNDLLFHPQNIGAQPGDLIAFQFISPHFVVQSDFTSPCHPIPSGFSSGLISPTRDEGSLFFLLTINNTDPIWFYESQYKNCQAGMVGVINQDPDSSATLGAFKILALSQTENISPDGGARGGLLDPNVEANSSSSISLDLSSSTNIIGQSDLSTTSTSPLSSSAIVRSSKTHASSNSSTSILISISTCPSASICPPSSTTTYPSPPMSPKTSPNPSPSTNKQPLFPGLNKGSTAIDTSAMNLGFMAVLEGVVLGMIWV